MGEPPCGYSRGQAACQHQILLYTFLSMANFVAYFGIDLHRSYLGDSGWTHIDMFSVVSIGVCHIGMGGGGGGGGG